MAVSEGSPEALVQSEAGSATARSRKDVAKADPLIESGDRLFVALYELRIDYLPVAE